VWIRPGESGLARGWRHRLSAVIGLALAAMVVASCTAELAHTRPPSGASSGAADTTLPTSDATPTDTPTEMPTPTAAPTATPAPAVSADDIILLCNKGTKIPLATAYGGKAHPLVLVTDTTAGWTIDSYGDRYDIDRNWSAGVWAHDLQLVVCVGSQGSKSAGACKNKYQRSSDGAIGKVTRYRYYLSIKVMVATTGKTLATKYLYGSTPVCGGTISLPSTPAPWRLYGTDVDDTAVNAYAVTLAGTK
jgi:hypothetical protein